MPASNGSKAALLLAAAAVCWGTNPIWVKLAGYDSLATAWLRIAIATLFLGISLGLGGGFTTSNLVYQLGSGTFFVLGSVAFVVACGHTSAANVTLLIYVFPIVTAILDFIVWRKKPGRNELMILGLGLGGLIVLLAPQISAQGALGNGLAVFAGTFFALHIFYARQLKHDKHVTNSILIGQILGLIVLPFFIHLEEWPTARQWLYLVGLGFFTGIPFLFWAAAVRYVAGHVAGTIIILEVPVAAFLGYLLFEEPVPVSTLLGGTLVITAAALSGSRVAKG